MKLIKHTEIPHNRLVTVVGCNPIEGNLDHITDSSDAGVKSDWSGRYQLSVKAIRVSEKAAGASYPKGCGVRPGVLVLVNTPAADAIKEQPIN